MKTNKDLIIEPNAAIEGRKYSEEKPWSCKYCYWWGGKKKGCSLKQCHYLLPEKKKPHGKQTIKQLNAQGVQLSNIKITDENIKSFDRVARKYGIDYSLKKEVGADPPKYLVFFKAKDVDVMTAAFREYAEVELKKKQAKKPSVRKKLQKSVERKAKHRQRVKQRQKSRGQER